MLSIFGWRFSILLLTIIIILVSHFLCRDNGEHHTLTRQAGISMGLGVGSDRYGIATRRAISRSRAHIIPLQRASRRTYRNRETKRDNAQVSEPRIETAIRLDKKELEKASLALSGQQEPNAAVAPMTGKLRSISAAILHLISNPNLIPEVLQSITLMDEGQRPIYLDMQATTPVDPRVLDASAAVSRRRLRQPHSRTHAYGWGEREEGVEDARAHIANLIGADPKEIIFTSGATESNNMSIKGVAKVLWPLGEEEAYHHESDRAQVCSRQLQAFAKMRASTSPTWQ